MHAYRCLGLHDAPPEASVLAGRPLHEEHCAGDASLVGVGRLDDDASSVLQSTRTVGSRVSVSRSACVSVSHRE